MRVLHVSFSDTHGGAAIAAYRLHRALLEAGADSRMAVIRKISNDPTVVAPLGRWGWRRARTARFVAKRLGMLQGEGTSIMRSVGVVPTGLGAWLNRSAADVVHLHWIGAEAMSIAEIAAITKPTVWTMHDMWAFCGTGHYDSFRHPGRYRNGYVHLRDRRWGVLDVDRWNYGRKANAWRDKRFHLVCPSRWMAACATESALLSNEASCVIPNTLNAELFKPVKREDARRKLGLPQDRRLILFGAENATTSFIKGFDLLRGALLRLSAENADLVIFGASARGATETGVEGFPARFLGKIHDQQRLAMLYSAADVFVAPSRQDNLPNTVVEALACGTPGVAFAVGGLPDIIDHQETGYLAEPFELDSLARGIEWTLEQDSIPMRERCCARAMERFAEPVVAARHLKVYEQVVAASGARERSVRSPSAKAILS